MASIPNSVSEPVPASTLTVSAGRVALLIGASVILNTVVGVFSGEKLSFLYKDVLGLSASGMATLRLVAGIPAYLRPLMGAGSDLFPLFGFHRRSYYAFSWLLMALGFLCLAGMHHYHYGSVLGLVIVTGAGGNLLFVIMDAIMVAVGNPTGRVGQFQTIQQGVPLLLGLTFAGPLSGYVTQHWSYTACFLTAALLALGGVPLALIITEERVGVARRGQETAEEHAARTAARAEERARVAASLRLAARSPGLWAVVGFVFYLIVTPGTNTAQFFYSVNVLHFSKQFLGTLAIPGSAGAIFGLLLFAFLSRRLPVRALVWGAFLMDCSLYLASMGLHSRTSGLVVTFLLSFLGTIYTLCLLTLAARACPPGIEGTVYGLVMSAISLAGALGEKLGASLFDYFGPPSHHTIAQGWFGLLWCGFAFTVLAAVFIPFLPAWAKSGEPLRPRESSVPPTVADEGAWPPPAVQ